MERLQPGRGAGCDATKILRKLPGLRDGGRQPRSRARGCSVPVLSGGSPGSAPGLCTHPAPLGSGLIWGRGSGVQLCPFPWGCRWVPGLGGRVLLLLRPPFLGFWGLRPPRCLQPWPCSVPVSALSFGFHFN